jgi:glycerol-3-phosphate acyltransferase PlsX
LLFPKNKIDPIRFDGQRQRLLPVFVLISVVSFQFRKEWYYFVEKWIIMNNEVSIMIKIVIDTKGADKGVDIIIKGVSLALEKFPEVCYLLVGDEEYIRAECDELLIPMDRVEIINASEEITNYDNPAEAVFTKRNSSMIRSLEALSERDDLFGFLTAGSTGALLVGAMRYLPRKTRVRPALAALLPNQSGGFTCVVDTGATVDCTPDMLHHFAHLGREFMREVYGIENAKIGLLSNGAEEGKGNALTKATFTLLKEDEALNFIGNVEGRDALSGVCDVLLCDGFAGNQVLKVTEGTAKRIITDVVKYARKTGSEDVMGLVKQLLAIYDMESLGGANLLGVSKPCVKMHGSCTEKTVVSSTEMLLNIAQNKSVFEKDKYTI